MRYFFKAVSMNSQTSSSVLAVIIRKQLNFGFSLSFVSLDVDGLFELVDEDSRPDGFLRKSFSNNLISSFRFEFMTVLLMDVDIAKCCASGNLMALFNFDCRFTVLVLGTELKKLVSKFTEYSLYFFP